jgi:hypothetical protein
MSTRRFVSGFMLPLVRGGAVGVGRPIGPRGLDLLLSQWSGPEALAAAPAEASEDPGTAIAVLPRGGRVVAREVAREMEGAAALATLRGARTRSVLHGASTPPLDEASLRLSVALHNLISLTHPTFTRAEGLHARVVVRSLAFSLATARLGPPPTALEAVWRYSLLARVPELLRAEHQVQYWLGARTLVGRAIPPSLVSWPRVRRVRVNSTHKRWLTEVGIPAGGREVWEALLEASPLGEALEPNRLDPPVTWRRLLSVLRFPSLCRIVAGRVVTLGIASAGETLALALLRDTNLRGTTFADRPAADATTFALQFLAHVYWMHLVSGGPGQPGPALTALLLASRDASPALVFPADVARASGWGLAFSRRLTVLHENAGFAASHREAASAVAALARGGHANLPV